MILPSCNLELTNPPGDWRMWLRNISDEELSSVRARIAQYVIKADSAMRPQIEVIERIAKDESALRFPGVVESRKAVKAALDSLQQMYDEAVKLRDTLRARIKTDADAYEDKLRIEKLISDGLRAENESLNIQIHGEPEDIQTAIIERLTT